MLPQHFARWRLEDCWKSVHVAKVIRCNWKIAQEAFMESYHVIATHPQILALIADANSQYDLYGDHVNRNLAAFGAPSPHLGEDGVTPQQTSTACCTHGAQPGALGVIDAGAARGPRAVLGDLNRRAFQRAFEGDFGDATDAERSMRSSTTCFRTSRPGAGSRRTSSIAGARTAATSGPASWK